MYCQISDVHLSGVMSGGFCRLYDGHEAGLFSSSSVAGVGSVAHNLRRGLGVTTRGS
jgi:hypothetical protein